MLKVKLFPLVLALAAAWCMPVFASAAGASLKVGVYKDELVGYAEKHGYFSRAGVAVEIVVSSISTPLMMSGKTDACIGGLASPVEYYLKGSEVTVLAQLYSSSDFYGISRLPLAGASKLKRVTAPAGGEPDLRMRAMLKYLGIKDPQRQNSRNNDAARYKLLEDGKTDLILINDLPLLGRIRAEGKYHVIEPRDVYKGRQFSIALFSRRAVVNARGPELERLVAALYEALEDIKTSPGPFIDYLAAKKGLTRQAAAEIAADIQRGASETGFEPDQASVDAIAAASELPEARKVKKSPAGLLFGDYAVKAKKARALRVKK